MTLSNTSFFKTSGRKFVIFQKSGRMNENLLRIAGNGIFLWNTFQNDIVNLRKIKEITSPMPIYYSLRHKNRFLNHHFNSDSISFFIFTNSIHLRNFIYLSFCLVDLPSIDFMSEMT